MIIIPYLIFYIGFFSYIIYEYFNIYEKRKIGELTKYSTDPFLQDFLSEIEGRHLEKGYFIAIIICYCCSMAIFIVAWILSHIFTKRYLRLLEMTKKNGLLNK